MKKMTVALLGDGLYTWDGGIDFVSNIAGILEYVNNNWEGYAIDIYLLLPREYLIVRAARYVASKGKRNDKEKFETFIKTIKDSCSAVKVVYYRQHVKKIYDDKGKSLERILSRINADICLPIWRGAYPSLSKPWIGYIPDFQEKYLGDLFSKETIEKRDNVTKNQVENTNFFLMTSDNAAEDLKRFYPGNYKVYAQPFAPIAAKSFWIIEKVNLEKYHLPKQYFLISNQFWPHKKHQTAIDAMKILREKGWDEVQLICTGRMSGDYRVAEYCNMLKQRVIDKKLENCVRFVGYIPKYDQIEMMKKAVALVQPSVFEGDPGGCSVYNANSLGVASIMTDIPVNMEAENHDNIFIFEKENAVDLASKMESLLLKNQEATFFNAKEIISNNNKNADILAKFYIDMIEEVIEKY